jgi:hypothetical protein
MRNLKLCAVGILVVTTAQAQQPAALTLAFSLATRLKSQPFESQIEGSAPHKAGI